MTPRSIRRAAERKAAKLARKADKVALLSAEVQLDTEPEALATNPISEARLAANRANAQLSTGPTSETGKAKVCLNAVKSALTGRTVLLPSDDAAEYERHLAAYEKEFKPVGKAECDLLQSIADTAWRLLRIPALEFGIYAQGRIRFADSFNQYEEALRSGLIEAEIYVQFEKQLRNLHLQEARLQRRRDKDMAEFRNLQKERNRRAADEFDRAAKLYLAALHDKKSFHPAAPDEAAVLSEPKTQANGFEFSTEDIEGYLRGVRAAQIARAALNPEKSRQQAA
jgi:hypothetical protein